ncbi:MAG: hypothetical protein JXR81_10755 [Candidatus Goldbacteria bacterium]|nr:hypothetical protein [Candidatus Goldiibacteriota bacterium]
MRKLMFIVLFISIFSFLNAAEQSAATALPDISFIGQAGLNAMADSDGNKEASVSFDGFEICATGYMHPDVRADFVVGAHNHDGSINFEVEEAYATFANLPFSTGLKAGRKLVDFGRINHIHSHEWLFLGAPLAYGSFLGEHSLAGDGASIDMLLPLPFFINVQAGIYRVSSAHSHEEAEESEEHHHAFSPAGEIYNARVWSSFAPAESAEIELGLSGLKGTGAHYLEHMDRIQMTGADFTFKFWPSAYSRLMVLAEAVYLKREVPPGTFESWGAYAYLGYRIDKQWEAALKYDWSETPGPEKTKKSVFSVIASNYMTESLKLRAEYSYSPEAQEHTGMLKVIFGIGPHTHPLQ